MSRGLGHAFLRHVERTRCIAFVLDMSDQARWSLLPIDQLRLLQNELRLYRRRLLDVPWLVVANKMDLVTSNGSIRTLREQVNADVLPISALERRGIAKLISAFHAIINKI